LIELLRLLRFEMPTWIVKEFFCTHCYSVVIPHLILGHYVLCNNCGYAVARTKDMVMIDEVFKKRHSRKAQEEGDAVSVQI